MEEKITQTAQTEDSGQFIINPYRSLPQFKAIFGGIPLLNHHLAREDLTRWRFNMATESFSWIFFKFGEHLLFQMWRTLEFSWTGLLRPHSKGHVRRSHFLATHPDFPFSSTKCLYLHKVSCRFKKSINIEVYVVNFP